MGITIVANQQGIIIASSVLGDQGTNNLTDWGYQSY